jgi:peptidoglycan/LPS O-acetylase OafA/YrhL
VQFISLKDLFSEITIIPEYLNQKTYPSLNGLRAVSILMVLLHHYILLYDNRLLSLYFIGPLGVDIFFVISGFLITTLCIKEKVLTKTLSLKNFYLRRALRILPVAWLYILVIFILNYFLGFHVSATTFIISFFFVANISFIKTTFDWTLAHYWSLSVEEQFYLLFPIFIKKKPGVFLAIVLFIPFAVPLLFYFQSIISVFNIGIVSALLHYLVKFQGISIGCLFSILLLKGRLKLGRFSLLTTLISISFISYVQYQPAVNLRSSFTNLAVSIFVGLIIAANIQPANNLIYKFLNLKLLSWIGILSYSIYIWQQLFCRTVTLTSR